MNTSMTCSYSAHLSGRIKHVITGLQLSLVHTRGQWSSLMRSGSGALSTRGTNLKKCAPDGVERDVLWYFHIYVDLGPDHFLFKISNFNIFGGYQKNEYFWGISVSVGYWQWTHSLSVNYPGGGVRLCYLVARNSLFNAIYRVTV